MMITDNLSALVKPIKRTVTRRILTHRILALHPTLHCDPTAFWDYSYKDLSDIEIGLHVSVGAFCEILIQRHSRHSKIPGKLVLKDKAIVSTGVNIRAAGGTIVVGNNSALGQNSVVLAANHATGNQQDRLRIPWDEERTGVHVGNNVWIGANSVLLPGCEIGDNTIVGAGSVVRGKIGADELWAGIPARRIKSLVSGGTSKG